MAIHGVPLYSLLIEEHCGSSLMASEDRRVFRAGRVCSDPALVYPHTKPLTSFLENIMYYYLIQDENYQVYENLYTI
jgi:hypothetical protein